VKYFYPAANQRRPYPELEPLFPWRTLLYNLHVSRLKKDSHSLPSYGPERSPDLSFTEDVIEHWF